MGDPSYMSPEQLIGGEVTERSDVYALGLLGFELLTGRSPYEANSKREMFTAHVHQEPKKLTELRDDVDMEMEKVVDSCLNKEPENRPNASDVQKRLGGLSSGEMTPIPALSSMRRTGPNGGLVGQVKERYLPQIMLVYGAIAWGILEVSSQLVDMNVVSDVVYRLALVAVVTGLPAVFIGAWFHGKKGRQEFQPIELWLFGGLAVIWLVVSSLILVGWLSR